MALPAACMVRGVPRPTAAVLVRRRPLIAKGPTYSSQSGRRRMRSRALTETPVVHTRHVLEGHHLDVCKAKRIRTPVCMIVLFLVATCVQMQLVSSFSPASYKRGRHHQPSQHKFTRDGTSLKSTTDDQIKELERHRAERKSISDKASTEKTNQKRTYNKRRGGRVRDRCSAAQNKKRRVRHLYSQARSLEKRGVWREASQILESILELDPTDAHSYLALARLESRRENGSKLRRSSLADYSNDEITLDGKVLPLHASQSNFRNASHIYEVGTTFCPDSVHLFHSWAMHENSLGNIDKARSLLDKALEIDEWNGYVCHSYGLIEVKQGNLTHARQLFQRGLTYQPSSTLVCSLGDLYVTIGHPRSAQELYSTYIPLLKNERERMEVYLAASSLEERVFFDIEKASDLLKEALMSGNVQDSRAYVALARLGTSGGLVDDTVIKKRIKEICLKQWHEFTRRSNGKGSSGKGGRSQVAFPVRDGRLFNAWAKIEAKSNLNEARKILRRGIRMYAKDHTLYLSLGNIEERKGNVTAARDLYSTSLLIKPCAPALVAYALLETRSPVVANRPNVTMVRQLLDEALLIDPKHGPLYNAYGNFERREGNFDKARQLYEDGIRYNCTDSSSVYHGLSKLHLSLGEVEEARRVLKEGLSIFGSKADTHCQRNQNVAYLSHTLAIIELNCNNNPVKAKRALVEGLRYERYSPQLLSILAICEARLGDNVAAVKLFEQSLKADQHHAQSWQAFGCLEMQLGNFRTAKTLFECGLKNAPNHGALWQAYGILESWKGNVSKARLLFAAGIEKCPNHVSLYQAWACLEMRSGDIITAKKLIGEALTRDKRSGSCWLVAAQVEEKAGNAGLVGLILRRGIECAPGEVELYRALADHEISRGRIGAARELLEKGIETFPFHAPLYHSLAELEARIGNFEGLLKLNKRTAELFPSDAGPASSSSSKERMEAWGRRITGKLSDGIVSLAEKIGVEEDSDGNVEGLGSVDPDALVTKMCGGLLMPELE